MPNKDLRNLTSGGANKPVSDEAKTVDLWSGLAPVSFKIGETKSKEWFSHAALVVERLDREDCVEITKTWTDSSTGLSVTAHIKEYKDYPAADWLLWFENAGNADTPIISDIQAIDAVFDLQKKDQPLAIYRLSGDDCDETSFRPINHLIGSGRSVTFAPERGRSSQKSAFPFFDVIGGNMSLIVAIGWTGQWAASISRNDEGQTRIAAGLEKTHFKLLPGEKVRTPRILILASNQQWIETHNRWRRLLIDHYLPRRNGELAWPPLSSQCFDRYSWTVPEWATEKGQIEGARATAKIGCDTHWFDAAWFPGGFPNGVGNQYCKPVEFPNGLKPVSDECKKLGINFLVWFEPERVADGTQIEKDHSEWVFGNLFRLDIKEACEWLTDLLDRRITEFGLDWYRQDFNMDPLDVWTNTDEPDRIGIAESHYIQNLYWMWDELVRRHPELMIDDCSSGGRRIDLEMMMRSHPLWRSDTGCAPGHAEYAQAQTMTLSLYVPVATTCSWVPSAYEMRSSGTTGLATQFDYLSPTFNWDEAKKAVQEAKDNAPFFWGDFYPLTSSSTTTEDFAAFQFHRTDLDAGIIVAFRRENCQIRSIEVVPHRINADKKYAVETINEDRIPTTEEMSGKVIRQGISLRIGQAGASLIWKYKAT